MIFYTLIFAAVAVLTVVAGAMYMSRNRTRRADEEHRASQHARADRSQTKAHRKQSAKARRQRH